MLPNVRSLSLPELRRRHDQLQRQLRRLITLRSQHNVTNIDWKRLDRWSLPCVALLILMAGIATGQLPWLVTGLLCLPLSIAVPLASIARVSADPSGHSNSIADQEIRRTRRQLEEVNRMLEES